MTALEASQLPLAADTVLSFLSSVGRRAEAELYLEVFRSQPRGSFALIAAERTVWHHAPEALVSQLSILASLGLRAPLVVGSVEPVAPDEELGHLLAGLELAGLAPTVVEGSSTDVLDQVSGALKRQRTPVLVFRKGPFPRQQQRVSLLVKITRALESRKLILVRSGGGLGPRGSGPLRLANGHQLARRASGLTVLNLRADGDAVAPLFDGDDALTLAFVRAYLQQFGAARVTVNITSPLALLRDLFTVKGAGTLVKSGSDLTVVRSYDQLDRERLRDLLQASFGKRLRDDFFSRQPAAIYLEADYRGVAVVEPSPVGYYLTKFAVEPVAQGEGIGQDLWHAMRRDFASLVWRARMGNPVSRWYEAVCDGMQRLEKWQVFWRGIAPGQVATAIDQVMTLPEDFEPVAAPKS